MFEMICRVFKIAGNSRRKIVAGIVCNILKSFFNGFMMFGVFWILLHLDGLSPVVIGQSFGVIMCSVLGRFFFQWMYDRTMSGSGYDIFRDYRLEIGDRLKQAPMGYFSEQNLGTIQAMLTTTIADLEGYSMLAIEQMTSGVAMAVLMSVMMFLFSPVIAGLSLVGLALGMLVLRRVRLRAAQYAPIYQEAQEHLVGKVMNLFLVGSYFSILCLQSSQLFIQLHTLASRSIGNPLFQISNGCTITSLLFMHIIGTDTGNGVRLIAVHINQSLKAVLLATVKQPVDRAFLINLAMVRIELIQKIIPNYIFWLTFASQCIGNEY